MIRPDFQRATAISFAAHVLVFLAALILTSLGPHKTNRTYTVSLISPATRTVKAPSPETSSPASAPVRRTPSQKHMPKKEQPAERTPQEKKKPEMAVKRDIAPIEKTNEAVEKIRREEEAREAVAHAEQKLKELQEQEALDRIRSRSAALGASGSWSNLSGEEQSRINQAYAASIMEKVRDNWVFGEVGYKGEIKVSITVMVDGTLVLNKIITPSSNRAYNDSLIKAIIKTKKVDPHPYGISEESILTFIPTD